MKIYIAITVILSFITFISWVRTKDVYDKMDVSNIIVNTLITGAGIALIIFG